MRGGSIDRAVAELIEDLANRAQAGEALDVEAVLAAHPEHAEQLRRLLPAIDVLADLGRSASAGGADVPRADAEPAAGVLGDFRIMREVGRGGMGVVYEAEQVSLGRRVALKVLPFAATMDPRQLQRFHNEARAAASLHHEHIVPVYGVGCERAVHFYAMQFIEGQSLAELIAAQRQTSASGGPPPSTTIAAAAPTQARRDATYFRRVAEWGIQAAEALEHAHALGIVHRDVKPANLIVDGRGKLWVTDFGLARLGADPGLTMTGDVLGTLRYMSPEQALAKHGLVDHRTDVYSLGATLYELLTSRPAIEGQDRQEILKRIADEEPRPPRALDRAVPADLETIVLKALAKDPAERYATARELTDDLRRFVEGRPIQARRPTLPHRLRKWAGRHQGTVTSAAALLLLALVALSVGTWLTWRAKNEKEEALGQKEVALGERDTALRKARQDRERAWQAVDRMYTQVATKWLNDEPRLSGLQRSFLEEALRLYQELSQEEANGPAVRRQIARAQYHVAGILSKTERPPEAERVYNDAIAGFTRLLAEYPGEPGDADDLAGSYAGLGNILHGAGRDPEAEQAYRRGLEIAEKLVRDYPGEAEYQHSLVTLYTGLGIVVYTPETEKGLLRARGICEQLVAGSPDNAEFHISLGGILNNLAIRQMMKGNPAEARKLLEPAIAHQQAALKINPRSKTALLFLHNHYAVLGGDVLRALGERAEALRVAREGLALAQQLAAEFPAVPGYIGNLADSYGDVGRALMDLGQLDEAEKALRQAKALREKGADETPVGALRGLFGEACASLGDCLAAGGRYQEAAAEYRRAREMDRENRGYKVNLAWALAVPATATKQDAAEAVALARQAVEQRPGEWQCWNALGGAQYRMGAWEQALQALRKGVELKTSGSPSTYLFMAMAQWHLGQQEPARQRYRQVAQFIDKTAKPQPEWRLLRTECAALLGILQPSAPKDKEVPGK